MTEAEAFFLSCVKDGQITVTRSGKITHVSTGHSTWATGSGRYPKMSKLDKSASKIRHIQCHRLVWLVFHGEIPFGLDVNHKNGDKQDYRLRNLELLTPLGNMQHAFRAGLIPCRKGVRNGYSKFTESDVATIKWMLNQGGLHKDIALLFNVHYVTIQSIDRGIRYTEIRAESPC